MSGPNRHSEAGEPPVLITEAARSYEEEFAARKRKYAWMMGLRFPCLILAGLTHQIPWLAVTFALLSVPLPWFAVLIANDRPVRKAEKSHKFQREPHAVERTEHRTIDG